MSRDFIDNNKDINSDAEVGRRRSFIERMDRKYQLKAAVFSPDAR